MARLIVNPTSPSSRREVGLHRLPFSIGRDPQSDLVIADRWVSRRHAVVEWRDDGYCLRDCGSSNGSLVNGDRITERRLSEGDVVAIGATSLLFGDRPAVACCAACAVAVALPARFCTACGSPLATREEAQTIEPSLPAGPGQLTAQHASLVRAVALSRADYLGRSYYRDPSTGQRTAHPVEEKEWSRFATYWAEEPIACIRAMNAAIAELHSPDRIRRYLEAAVELETMMDRGALRAPEGRVFSGIPRYIMDGYTDMGHNPSPTARRGREKIRVDKQSLKPWLVESRWRALACEPALPELLAGFYEVVRRRLRLDEARVALLSDDWGDRSISLSRFLDDGVGLCRHLSILYQLCLQEAGIPARVVKGTLRVFGMGGRHAWNLAWHRGRVALVDVTLPSRHGPLILVGESQEEVYRMANQGERRYLPTSDDQNHYKIGRAAD